MGSTARSGVNTNHRAVGKSAFAELAFGFSRHGQQQRTYRDLQYCRPNWVSERDVVWTLERTGATNQHIVKAYAFYTKPLVQMSPAAQTVTTGLDSEGLRAELVRNAKAGTFRCGAHGSGKGRGIEAAFQTIFRPAARHHAASCASMPNSSSIVGGMTNPTMPLVGVARVPLPAEDAWFKKSLEQWMPGVADRESVASRTATLRTWTTMSHWGMARVHLIFNVGPILPVGSQPPRSPKGAAIYLRHGPRSNQFKIVLSAGQVIDFVTQDGQVWSICEAPVSMVQESVAMGYARGPLVKTLADNQARYTAGDKQPRCLRLLATFAIDYTNGPVQMYDVGRYIGNPVHFKQGHAMLSGIYA